MAVGVLWTPPLLALVLVQRETEHGASWLGSWVLKIQLEKAGRQWGDRDCPYSSQAPTRCCCWQDPPGSALQASALSLYLQGRTDPEPCNAPAELWLLLCSRALLPTSCSFFVEPSPSLLHLKALPCQILLIKLLICGTPSFRA